MRRLSLRYETPWWLCYNGLMTSALEEAIERLKKMPADRQDAFARLILREILADEQWQRSAAQNAEWRRQRVSEAVISNGV
jgi:hypothetical protein